MSSSEDFFSEYFKYVRDTEPPVIYHRWCGITSIGAVLGRDYCFPHGHFTLFPNFYAMLIGVSGDRKTTAIKMSKQLMTAYGYSNFGADKTSKEKLLLDLAGQGVDGDEDVTQDILDKNLFGDPDGTPAEMYIVADEFNDFLGNGNIDFISLLGNLWDYSGIYKSRIKNGKSVSVTDPTINLLGGNTPTNFSLAFPAETLGQGFFSRLLLIYGEPSGRQITFPSKPSAESTAIMVEVLREIKRSVIGVAKITSGAEKLLDKLYKTWRGINDIRFESYSNRRFTHLLKLCLIVSASRFSTTISESVVIYANTILTHAESFMPKAMGEFGKARHSDVAHKVLQILRSADKPITARELWKQVRNDLERPDNLSVLLGNLIQADKIFAEQGGFLACIVAAEEVDSDLLDYSLLTDEEREMKR